MSQLSLWAHFANLHTLPAGVDFSLQTRGCERSTDMVHAIYLYLAVIALSAGAVASYVLPLP